MSRFFAAHSDSESSSSSSESEDEPQQRFAPTAAAAFAFSDDEEDTKRIVRSAKEKRYESLHTIIKAIRNSKKINDFNKMETSFVDLCKAYEKAKPVIAKEEPNGETPKFYLRILVEMDDLINKTWEDKDLRKSMNKNNSKSLGALRQKLRKYIRTDFDDAVAKFRENPEEEEEDEPAEKEPESAEESDAEEEMVPAPKAKTAAASKFKKVAATKDDDDDDSDDSYWTESDESSSSSDNDPGVSLIEKFLKKKGPASSKDDDKEKKKGTRPKKIRKQIEEEDEDEDDEDWIKVDHGAAEKPKMFEKDAEINHQLVVKKLIEIMAARGKKRTNRKEQIELLSELYRICEEHNLGSAILIKIQFAICAAIFDYNPKISAAMKPEYWEKCMPCVEFLLKLISDNEDVTIGDHISDEQETLEQAPYKVRGDFLSVVERLDEEFVKVLKSCDAHSNEYVDRLKDEPRVVQILNEAQKLVERGGNARDLCRIYLKRIEHIYFKFDPKAISQKNGELSAKEETSIQVMDKLCKFIYANDSTDRLRTQAILCHIYHHAIHDRWFEARDLMLMSHLQDAINHADPLTQILYNRTMVQVGLCAFRHAEIKEAHNALLDIQLGGRSKELLAQGLLPQRHHERSTEQEKIEKQRQVPFHMHINLEMLECVYLVSAMLMEIPYMAAHEFDARRRMISKSYYQQLRSSERQALVGPPESMREHVVAASKAMRNGNWKRCKELIINDKMNAKVWDLFNEADKVRTMLAHRIQEETLRTYLFTYSKVYDSISVPHLADLFEMKKESVHAIVSKMIINEELMASLDEPSECMVMHRTDPTRLQSLSLQLSDKIAQLVENNERLLELRPGGWQGQWRGKDDRGGGGGREGGIFGGGNFGGNFGGNSNRGGGNFGGKNVKFGGDRKFDRGERKNYDRGDRKFERGDRKFDRGDRSKNYEKRNYDNRRDQEGRRHQNRERE